jgi:hypothetical protein
MWDIPATEPSPPQERAAHAVRAVLGRLSQQKDLLLLDEINIDAVAIDVSREVYRDGRAPGPTTASAG